MVLGITFAAVLALQLVSLPLMGRGYEFVYFLSGLAQAFLLTPALIAGASLRDDRGGYDRPIGRGPAIRDFNVSSSMP